MSAFGFPLRRFDLRNWKLEANHDNTEILRQIKSGHSLDKIDVDLLDELS